MKFVTGLFIVLSFFSIAAQEVVKPISVSFDNVSLKEAFESIEETSNYRFYYPKSWLGATMVDADFKNLSIEEILEGILHNTTLNFYVLDGNKVILTQNSIIYDEFPKGFFGKYNDSIASTNFEIDELNNAPIFYDDNIKSNAKVIQTYRIGRENRKSNKRSYELSGYVTDSETGEPLSNLSIILRDSNSGVVTDESGYYSLSLPAGNNILETRSLGIENIFIRVIIYNDGNLNIELGEDVEQLDEVVLQANLDKNIKNTISGATEIDIEESKNIPLILGERDVLKVATSLPGISTAGEGSAGFNVRGGKTDQNLILLDNSVLYSPQHFFGIFAALNPFTLGEVEIYKGSIPSEYGGRLSSVFDIKTKKPNADKFSGEGSIGPVTGNLVLEVPVVKGKSALLLGGRGAYANWILKSLDEESLNDSQASFYDLTAAYDHQINENNQIKVTAYASRDDFSITSDSLNIYKNRVFALNWNHQINDRNSLGITLANSRYDFEIDFDGNSNNDFRLGYSINETGFKFKLKKIIDSKITLDYGLSTKLYEINPGSLQPVGEESSVLPVNIPKERGLESAIFFSSNIDISKRFSLDAGVRFSLFNALGPGTQLVYEENQPKNENTVEEILNFENNKVIETYGGPEFRISTRYLLSEDFSLKASFNNTYQFIHRLSNNTTVSPIDTWILSDLNIKPQKAKQYALGIFKNFKQNMYETSIEGFYKTSDAILDFKTGAQILLNENIEQQVLQGEGKAYGFELLIRKNSGKLNGWFGYTYSRAFIKLDSEFNEERVNNGEFFPSNFDKPHDFSLVTNYKFTKRFSLSTNFVYQTGRPVTFPVGNFTYEGSNYVVFSDRNQFRIPDFYRLDLGFNVEGNHKKNKLAHSFWTFSIYNVLGRNNPFSVFFVTEQGQIKPFQSSIFSIPVPSITYNFKF